MKEVKPFLNDWFVRPYFDGVNDCAIFLAEWLDLHHDTEYAETLRGSYKSKMQGLRQFARLGLAHQVLEAYQSNGWTDAEEHDDGCLAVINDQTCGILWASSIWIPIHGLMGLQKIHKSEARRFLCLKP